MARAVLTVVCALMIGLGAGVVWAAPIEKGFDLLTTPGGAFLPLPPDNPFGVDRIPLVSDPIIPGTNVDTIIDRMSGLPDGGTGVIEAAIVALSLRGSATDLQGVPWDLSLRPNPERKSTGQVMITGHDDGGGTFDSFFDVFTLTTFTSGDRSFIFPSEDRIASSGSTWSHTMPANYPVLPNFPAGGFFPGPIRHTGPHPNTNPGSVPEPTTLLILGAGLAGLGAAAWRRRGSG